MKFFHFFLVFIFLSCGKTQQAEPVNESIPEDSTSQGQSDTNENSEKTYNDQDFFGVYDHESTSPSFSGVLSLRQNGNDMYFTVSIAHGSCQGETEGVVLIIERGEDYYSGFYESENCRLQFTLVRAEKKVDIKEVTLCSVLGNNCSYEGAYIKRKE